MMKTAGTLVTVIAATLLAACGGGGGEGMEPIVAAWEMPVGDYRNTLEIDEDLGGRATVYFVASDGYLYYLDFRVDAEPLSGDRYALDLECIGDCASYDIEMDCELYDEGDKMQCNAYGGWSSYQFDWELR